MAFEITGTGRAVPSKRVSNEELSMEINTSDEWIRSHTGIGARYISGAKTASSDLALEAAKKALAMAAGLDVQEETALAEAALSIDMIIIATATPDYYGSPATACIVQEKLGAKNAAAMDITAGCTGFIYAMETAAGMLSIGERKRILVIGSETLTKFTDWTDRTSCVLFGDGAGAVLLEKTPSPGKGNGRRGLVRTILRADGSGAEYISFMRGGSRNPFKAGEVIEKPPFIAMDGQAVYSFAVRAMISAIEEILSVENISLDALAFVIPHQANARIIQSASRRLKIPEEKCIINLDEYANTSAASIPIALDELNQAGKLKHGDFILTVGFGAGLTYGANLIVW